jgi:hypothetical protein
VNWRDASKLHGKWFMSHQAFGPLLYFAENCVSLDGKSALGEKTVLFNRSIVLPGNGSGPELKVMAIRVVGSLREQHGLNISRRHELHAA